MNGRTVLQQITFKTSHDEPKGRFCKQRVTKYTVYERGTLKEGKQRPRPGVMWERYREDDAHGLVLESSGVLGNQVEIPVACVYGRQTGFLRSRPPLRALADLNILHTQTLSDYFHCMHIADVPMLVTVGAGDDGDVEIGPNSVLLLPEGASARWIETTGNALGHTRQALEDLKGEMATLGLNFLSPDKRAAETAEAKRLDKTEGDSALASIARSLEDAVELALGFHARYMGLASGGSVKLNRDYQEQKLTPAEIKAWSDLVASDQVSLETLWTVLQAGGVLPPDFDKAVEAMRLEQQIGVRFEAAA